MVLMGWKLRKRKWMNTTRRLIEELESYMNAPDMFSIRIHRAGIFHKYPSRRYVDGHVDIFDMVDIDLFIMIAFNRMVLQLRYTGGFEPRFYNYLRPLSSLDEGLCPLSFVNSYQRPPPQVMATIEDISQPGTSAAIEYKSHKMLLLTWHDSSTPARDYVCDSVRPRCMPHGMLTPHTDEFVITYTVIIDVIRQLSFKETKLDGGAGFGDVAGSGIDSYGLSHDKSFGVDDLDLNVILTLDLNVSKTETQEEVYVFEAHIVDEVVDGSVEEGIIHGSGEEDVEQYHVESSENACANDDDDEDDDFLVDDENEILEHDVDVHLFGISKDVPFDNIGVTSLVPKDLLKGRDVDVVNLNGFNSDSGNDNKTRTYRRRMLIGLRGEMDGVMNDNGRWKYSFYTEHKFSSSKRLRTQSTYITVKA
uniref:Uncharacterized protein n=1 Tax=Tanacetum cinerariifolium TaxID=118510 RepID=A0A6L2KPS8_TANCI|nr:hypothetical protein [Tanacetum cinerariifolium]